MLVNSAFEITVSGVRAANRLWNAPTEGTIQRRNRKRWAVALKVSGKTYYMVGEKKILSDGLHPVILPKGCSYSWQCVEPGECLIIEFDAAEEADQITSFPVTDNSFFVQAFLKIQKCLQQPSPAARMEGLSRLYDILSQLAKTDRREYVSREKKDILQPAVRYMTERYYDPNITNGALAKMCGISTVYFRKCFEAAWGISPIRFLHDLRIRKAKDILSSDYGSVAQVAESVGYNSVYHFSKMFKHYTGISPTQYTKNTAL